MPSEQWFDDIFSSPYYEGDLDYLVLQFALRGGLPWWCPKCKFPSLFVSLSLTLFTTGIQ